ncbi:TPM domain-containing protein [Cognatilysobacter bugurensis]|nr:TPM domain-containing protein [Lysobacter bugurensis]
MPLAARAQALAPIPPLDSPVVDTTGTLDAAARARLVAQAQALHQRKGSQLQVLVVPTTQPEDIAQYAVRAFDQWKIGRKEVDDGVLVVAALRDRRVRIEVGYGLEGAIPDATAARVIQEYIVPRFREGDIAGGLADGTAVLARLIDGEALPAPMASHAPSAPARSGDGGGGGLFALFAAFIAAQVARAMFGGAPRPLRGLLGAGVGGGIAWLLSSMLFVGVIGALLGALLGFAGRPAGRFARHRGYGGLGGMPIIIGGGGGFGGGGGGFGGGGWSGGGGMSGGGGASGSW